MNLEQKKVPPPVGICDTCLNDCNATYPLCEDSTVLVSYCRHHQTGGFIQMGLEEVRWTMFSPVQENAWRWFIEDAICDVIEQDPMHVFDGLPKWPCAYGTTIH